MAVELKYSEYLTKRLKTDSDLKCLLLSQYLIFETGIKSKKIKSSVQSVTVSDEEDSDEESDKILLDGEFEVKGSVQNVLRLHHNHKNLLKNMVANKKLVKDKNGTKKILVLTPLTINKPINPVKYMRFLDQSFPLNSIIFSDTTLEQNKIKVNNLNDIYDFKRAQFTNYYAKDTLFTVKLQEKIHNPKQFDQSIIMQGYYSEWLMRLGNSKAMELLKFIKLIQAVEETGKKLIQQLDAQILAETQSAVPKSSSRNINTVNIKPKKMKLWQIDDKLKAYLLTQPQRTRTVKYVRDPDEESTGQIQEEFNMDLLKLMGYKDADTNDIFSELLNFKIQRSIICPDFCELTEKWKKKFTTVEASKTDIQCHQDVTWLIYNRDGVDVKKCKNKVCDEFWYENGCMYRKQWCVFHEIANYH